jgi:transketolase
MTLDQERPSMARAERLRHRRQTSTDRRPGLSTADEARLVELATGVRRRVLQTVHRAGSGHVGGSLSVVEILVVLYFHELRIDPAQPDLEDRDRLVFSKGHASPALYAVLAERGYFPVEELDTFDAIDSRLQAHPDMTALPGLDMSTGSLGQGLSVGVGMALAARMLNRQWRTYVVIGDGETQEGQVWEASFAAARYGLDNLVAILDWNGLQQYGWHRPGRPTSERMNPIDDPVGRWETLGWRAIELDGHSVRALADGLAEARGTKGRPTILVARTVKGKGVSFMENDFRWHARPMTDEDLRRAIEELGA